MSIKTLPKYPVYVPSKGRHETPYTARVLAEDGVPFVIVCEPQERDAYAKLVESLRDCKLLVLPEDDQGLVYVRRFIRAHATQSGAKRHWQIDDNIRRFRRWYRNKRLRCRAGCALRIVEQFSDRYENVAISGLNYTMFAHQGGSATPPTKPFWLNVHVYSCSLFLNAMPFDFRLPYNDDVDICLQVVSSGEWCTVLFNAFMCDKLRTMTVKGGMDYEGDARAKGTRLLQRHWPHVVDIDRKWQRPHFVVRERWRKFATPLRRRTDIDWDAIENGAESIAMQCKAVGDVKSRELRDIVEGDA